MDLLIGLLVLVHCKAMGPVSIIEPAGLSITCAVGDTVLVRAAWAEIEDGGIDGCAQTLVAAAEVGLAVIEPNPIIPAYDAFQYEWQIVATSVGQHDVLILGQWKAAGGSGDPDEEIESETVTIRVVRIRQERRFKDDRGD